MMKISWNRYILLRLFCCFSNKLTFSRLKFLIGRKNISLSVLNQAQNNEVLVSYRTVECIFINIIFVIKLLTIYINNTNMKLLYLLLAAALPYQLFAQCAGATPITNGNCLTGQSFTSSAGGIVAGCNGGSNPWTSYSFTAPATCVDFDISNIAGNGTDLAWQYVFYNSACGAVAGACIEQVSDGQTFTITADNTSGTYLLTPGATYYLLIMGDNACTFDICMSNTTDPSNACAGALGLGTTTTTYYNGSAGCAFSGTQTGGTGDPAATNMCAGSLENTQWVNFSPAAGSSSFQVIGTGIDCTGGACAYQFGIFSSPTNCGALTPEGCVANGTACGPGPDPNSQVTYAGGNNLVWSGVSASGFTATISPASGTFTGTEEFYLIMDGNAGASCTYTLQGVNVQPLPIDLIYFKVKPLNNANYVTFQVASQTDNDYFTIQRSTDNENWADIKTIDGAGTTTQSSKYGYTDTEFHRGLNYYRLMQTDFDGTSRYSESVSVENGSDGKVVATVHNMQGQQVTVDTPGLIIIQYTDGSIEKRVN